MAKNFLFTERRTSANPSEANFRDLVACFSTIVLTHKNRMSVFGCVYQRPLGKECGETLTLP